MCEVNKKNGSYAITALSDLELPVSYSLTHFSFIYTTINQNMVNVTFEYCSSYKSLPPLVHLIYGLVNKYSSDFIHACPYKPKKHFGVDSFPIDAFAVLFTMFNYQLGNYKTSIEFKDRNGEMIFFVNFYSLVSRKRIQKSG